MARDVVKRPGGSQRSILDELVQQKGLRPGEYVLFLVSREGILWPPHTEEFEETSGHVLDKRCRVFAFWLGWDHTTGSPVLTEWAEVRPETHWASVGEYRRARQELGLPAASVTPFPVRDIPAR